MSPASAPPRGAAKKRRARNDPRRERNRQSLIDATVALVLEQGSGGLSMVAITKRAGVHHPAFYSQFRNVEECLEAAFKHVLDARHEQTMTLRESLWYAGGAVRRERWPQTRRRFATEVAVTENSLRNVLKYRQFYLLVLQCRHEQTRIGELARGEFDRNVQEITEYAWQAALHFGAEARHLREYERLARYILEGIAAASLDALHGRTKDLHALAERLTRYHWALVTAERKHLRGDSALTDTPHKPRPR